MNLDSVNTDKSIALVVQLMKDHKQGWPRMSHKPLASNVTLFFNARKPAKANGNAVYATSQICTLNELAECDVNDVLPHKLAGVPSKIFHGKSSKMSLPSAKSTMQDRLRVEISNRISGDIALALWFITFLLPCPL